MKTLKMGDPLREETRLGPMIDEQSAQRIESWVTEAVKEGAVLAYGEDAKVRSMNRQSLLKQRRR